MRGAGLEPARYFYHEPLKLACLPFHHPRTLADYSLKPAETPADAATDWTSPPISAQAQQAQAPQGQPISRSAPAWPAQL